MWDSESESSADNNGVLNGVQSNMFEQRGQSWHVSTDIPSDLTVQVGAISFHLHKFPLLTKSGKINRIIHESRETELKNISLHELPGGHEAFELAAKFCYGVSIDLTATAIAALRCAAEYLEMTEDLEQENLIVKTEAFLNYVVLSSWEDSLLVLKCCEKLSPWAEDLQIVGRCSESVALKACTEAQLQDNREQEGWSPNMSLDWWCEDASVLGIDHFVLVITAIKAKGMKHESVGAAIMHYAVKWLPGMIRDGSSGLVEESDGVTASAGVGISTSGQNMIMVVNNGDHCCNPQREHQRTIIESLISIIPPQNDSVSCSFLLRLLRAANTVCVSPALVIDLEKWAGMQLEKATLVDLLIPCYSKSDMMYDVDLFRRLLEHFLIQRRMEISSPRRNLIVARLVDGYLAQVSRDKNLSLTKFQVLAQALPESVRSCDDGLYCAIDSYLKAHPMLSEHDRARLCRLMDFQKLSTDACIHAAQNERLPIRVTIQVILSDQIKLNNTLANASFKESRDNHHQPNIRNRKTLLEETPQSFKEEWENVQKDISMLKFDLETVKTKYLELQHDMEGLQRQSDNVTKLKQHSALSNSWKKLIKMTKIIKTENAQVGSQGNAKPTINIRQRWRYSVS